MRFDGLALSNIQLMQFSREVQNLIANLREVPEDRSRMVDRRSKPINSIIEVLLEKYHINNPRPEQVLMSNWMDLVGKQHAHGCAPEKIDRGGRLHVRVSNPMLRRELEFNKLRLLHSIQRLPQCDHIRDLIFKAG
jgi:hypothetical protein